MPSIRDMLGTGSQEAIESMKKDFESGVSESTEAISRVVPKPRIWVYAENAIVDAIGAVIENSIIECILQKTDHKAPKRLWVFADTSLSGRRCEFPGLSWLETRLSEGDELDQSRIIVFGFLQPERYGSLSELTSPRSRMLCRARHRSLLG